jgi:hypothetical protein
MVLPEVSSVLRLADVLHSCLLALEEQENPLGLAPVKKAAVLVVDGLGALNLSARAGHARWLSNAWATRGLRADSGFPSTTASALTTLTTGVLAGQHGIAGYTLRDPVSLKIINHLKTWRPDVDPGVWQRSQTLFEKAARRGIASLALGEHRFSGSDFTEATWRGASFQGTSNLREQGEKLREFFDAHDRALVYLYWPALDRTGHSSGVGSDAWIHRLEELDSELRELTSVFRGDEGLVVTSDHGMVDVLSEHKVLISEGSPLLEGVVGWAGEPRAPQIYCDDPVAAQDVYQAWSETLGSAALVMTREDLVESGWLGDVHPDVVPRLGDVVVLALDNIALYREASSSPTSLAMLGQHGSITQVEREIPIIPLAAWA